MEIVAWGLGRRRRFRVSGRSMLPCVLPEDELLVDTRAKPKQGDVIVARHPFKRDVHLVKRVASIQDGDRFRLVGSNPSESTDSRSLGSIPGALVLGRVTSRL